MLSRLKKLWEIFTGVEKKLLLVFVLLLLASITALIVENRQNRVVVPKRGGTYIEGLVGSPAHLNPLLSSVSAVDADLTRIVYAGLLKFDNKLNLLPDLAESLPQISPNGRDYTLKLRSNIFWHDGAAITADDVVFTIKAIQNRELQSTLLNSWSRVDVQKLDGQTVKISTREPSATFISNLTVGILPKHIWENVPADSFALSKFNLEPVGSGPFRVTEIKRGRAGEIRSITFKPFTMYYAGGAYLNTLIFKFYPNTSELIDAYHSREIMGLGYEPYDQNLFIEPNKKLRQIQLPLSQYQAVFINRAKNPAPLEDTRVRLALAKSVDKKEIIKTVYGGQTSEAYGPILPGYLGYHEQIPGADMNIYNLEKSKSLLEDAGWKPVPGSAYRQDKLGRTLALELATNNFPPNVQVAQELKKMWEGLGIQISLNIETFADLEEKFITPKNYELLLYSQNIGVDPDPYPYWHSSQLRSPGVNFSTFSNKTADKLLVDARANIPAPERAAKYKKFQEIFVGDVPAIFLNRGVFVYNLPTTIKGADFNTIFIPPERFTDINQWYIETKRVKQ